MTYICQANCRKVRGSPTKIVVKLIENLLMLKYLRQVDGNTCSMNPL